MADEKVETSAKTTSSKPKVEKVYREPGFRHVDTTSVFRAVNPELFMRPNRVIMAMGCTLITLSVAYLGYMNATAENRKDSYVALNEDGSFRRRKKTSKWD